MSNNKHSIIKLRRGTAADWSSSQPQPGGEVLKLGEPGYEKDTGKLKIGDGITPWNNLPYINGGAAISPEDVQDLLGESGFLVEGDGIGLVYDDDNNTLTISNTKSTYDAAVQWTANHTLVDGTRYLAGDLVYSGGNLYRAKYDNESQPVTNTTYWENIGPGYRLNIDGRDIPNIPYPVKSVNGQTGDVVIESGNPFDQNLNTTDFPTFTNLNLNTVESIVVPDNTIVWIGSEIEVPSLPGSISYTPEYFIPNNNYGLQVGDIVPGYGFVNYCDYGTITIGSLEEYNHEGTDGYKFVLTDTCTIEVWPEPTWHLTNPTFYSPNTSNVNINFTTKLNDTGSIIRDNNSGDGNNKGTFKIIPDNSLLNNDQYLIVDPTAPNHIHLRAGGTQDNSAAELIIGGEYAHVNITDYNHQVNIRTDGGEIDTTINLGLPYFLDGHNFATEFIPPYGSTITVGDVVYTVIASWDNTHAGEDKGIYLSPSTPILEYGNYPIHLASIPKSWTFQNNGVLQLASGGIKFSDDTIQTTAATGGGSGLNDTDTYIFCKTGDDLAAKYAAAKLLTPGGNPLSSTNRATLIILPGNYSLSGVLVVDAEFVDILGLGSTKLDRGCVTAVTLVDNTISVTANNVKVKGISVGSQNFQVGDNLPNQNIEDCIGGDYSFGGSSGHLTGIFTNCSGGNYSFGGNGGNLEGTFTNCSGGDYSFGGQSGFTSGYFTNCSGQNNSFGGDQAYGYFSGCVGGDNSFGGGSGSAFGTFSNCTAGAGSFGGVQLYGILLNCRLTSGTFNTVSGSGKIRLCIDGNYNVINADAP